MSLNHDPTRLSVKGVSPAENTEETQGDYWYALMREAEAADFLGLSVRSMQGFRYHGGGPRFVRISSRCIRYRRADLRTWVEQRLCASTSDYCQAGS